MPENTTKILNKKVKAANRHWKNFIDKDYLGSHNLEESEEMLLTIDRFEGEEKVKTKDGEKVMQVIYFKEDVPKMIMNITNGNTISSLYGTHPDQWAGKKVQLFATKVKAIGGGMQDALRVRDFVPQYVLDPKYIAELSKATDLESLKTLFTMLPESVKTNPEIIARKDEMKKRFSV